MTDEIAELRALLARATKEPWIVTAPAGRLMAPYVTADGDYIVSADDRTAKDAADDLALIVAAVNALPGLLSRVEAAESALAASRAREVALREALTQVQHESESFQWADGMPAKAGRVAMQIVAEVASRALAEKGDGK